MTGVVIAAVMLSPLIAASILAIVSWLGKSREEQLIFRIVRGSFVLSVVGCLYLGWVVLRSDTHSVSLSFKPWFQVGEYAFQLRFIADPLSVSLAGLSLSLLAVVVVFSGKYLRREPGYLRFFFLLCLLATGISELLFAGTLDSMYFGWELVGLSSTLLIAFFYERPAPVRHAMRAFVTYRLCDVGFLAAAVLLHHSHGAVSLHPVEGSVSWWVLAPPSSPTMQLTVGLALLWASMGKSAQFPLGGWLPRAMEGPTPSSAIFYGAVSIHLGPYLLLRSAALIEQAPFVHWAVIVVGLLTTLHATLVGRVQTDVKSGLAYATMTQVGLIYIEIGFGWYHLALIHIIGNASLRCLQLLRSPSILYDKFALEKQLNAPLPSTGLHLEFLFPRAIKVWLYRGALERGYLDACLRDYLFSPLFLVLGVLDKWEECWANFLIRRKPPAKPSRFEAHQEARE